jgi:hypothetical protein
MNPSDIARYRLINQQIALAQCRNAAELLAEFGAMQGQDYPGALWSIGLRLPEATETTVEQAVAGRTIVRTWMMRGTLHFIAARDVHWMLSLLAPRTIASVAHWRRRLELDDRLLGRCRKLFTTALEGGRQLAREHVLDLLEQNKISTASQRGYVILWHLAQEGLICFAARSGKQHGFALLDEWVARPRRLEREAALAELARRYFTSHGPATLADFVWWSGLKVSDARTGLDAISSKLSRHSVDGAIYWMPRDLPDRAGSSAAVYLLPGFDEYLLGYKDRSAVLDARHARKIVPGGNGVFLPTVVINGRVAGIWKRTSRKKSGAVTVTLFKPLKKVEKNALAVAAERFGRFAGMAMKIEFPKANG